MLFSVMRQAECSKGNENERQTRKKEQTELNYDEVTFLERQVQ